MPLAFPYLPHKSLIAEIVIIFIDLEMEIELSLTGRRFIVIFFILINLITFN